MNSMQNKTLSDWLSELEDHRRTQGRRHELRFVLLIVIMAVMSGCFSLRAMRDFIHKNKRDLIDTFHPKENRLPSHQTIGRVLQETNFEKLATIFQSWASTQISLGNQPWISLDGKAICGTVEHSGSAFQNFTSVVTAFASHCKQSLATGKLHTKKENELPTVRQIIDILGLKKMCHHS